MILDLRAAAAKNDIKVVSEIPPLISQVFQNLLGNTFKYAARGKVTVSAHEDAGTIVCVVHDNGAGTPLEILPKVFDKLATDPDMEAPDLDWRSSSRSWTGTAAR